MGQKWPLEAVSTGDSSSVASLASQEKRGFGHRVWGFFVCLGVVCLGFFLKCITSKEDISSLRLPLLLFLLMARQINAEVCNVAAKVSVIITL